MKRFAVHAGTLCEKRWCLDCKLPPPIRRLDGEERARVAAGEELHFRLIGSNPGS